MKKIPFPLNPDDYDCNFGAMYNQPLLKCTNCNQIPKDPEELELYDECERCRLIDIADIMLDEAKYAHIDRAWKNGKDDNGN